VTRAEWDVTLPPPAGLPEVDVVFHAAAWTDVEGAESSPQDAAAMNVGGTQHAFELGAPVVLFSTDYVFDGRKREPYVESDAPSPLSVYGRSKLQAEAVVGADAWIVRTSWLYEWTHQNFAHHARPGRRARRGGGRPDAPSLPHWRDGLRACLERLGT
jgi:dTDP-4-dehydrorhamnose reductase